MKKLFKPIGRHRVYVLFQTSRILNYIDAVKYNFQAHGKTERTYLRNVIGIFFIINKL